MKSRVRLFVAVCLLCVGGIAGAVVLLPPPDEELASHEVVVVAKWNPTTVICRSKSNWNAELDGLEEQEFEMFTTIEVIRTIKGDLKPGNHKIRMPLSSVSFRTIKKGNGPTLYWFGSTEHPGAVEDVTVPCLWFLKTSRSWTKEDNILYPTLTTLFGVQPLAKEKHFTGLIRKQDQSQRDR